MSLTPPSSRDASSIDGVVVTGTPTAGDTIVADSATAAHWGAAGGGASGLLELDMGSLPTLGDLREEVVADFAQNMASTMTSPPLIVPAAGTVVAYGLAVSDVPDISDTLDITYTLYVTDQAGVNTGLVSGTSSTTTPTDNFDVHFDGTSATIVGVDLTWDDAGGAFTSAAGGIYTALIFVTTGPD